MSGSQQLLLGETGGASGPANVENVFNVYTYTGTGSALSLTTGLNMVSKGGLVWNKGRTVASNHDLIDTSRGVTNAIFTNTTGATATSSAGDGLASFDATGVTFGPTYWTGMNQSTIKSVLWSFCEQQKFFDIVLYTGNGTSQAISHNLGSLPGWIVSKRLDNTSAWDSVTRFSDTNYFGGNGATSWGWNQSTVAQAGVSPADRQITTTTFNPTFLKGTLGSGGDATAANVNGATYVAYLFAHNAGGFGPLETDSIVFCGSFASTGQVTVGFEPQYVLMKAYDNTNSFTGDWRIFDTMRGIYIGDDNQLFANNSNVQDTGSYGTVLYVNATGFVVESQGVAGSGTVFIAIRRGPMAIPTVGTSVYSQVFFAGDSTSNRAFTTGFPVDTNLVKGVNGVNWNCWGLRKTGQGMSASNTDNNQYQPLAGWIGYDNNTQLVYPTAYQYSNATGYNYLSNSFGRAPKFHDVQVWKGTGGNFTVGHCLTIPPELVIIKNITTSDQNWVVYSATTGANQYLNFNFANAVGTFNYWQNTTPTSSDFYVSSNGSINGSGDTMQAMMWATCPGVSKVGSYTGTGGAQTINCAFTTGARFVMIKRTDSSGGWYIFSTAMGMSSGSSPYYFANSDAAYVTGVDYINTTNVGFNVTSSAPSGLNGSGGTFLFLAIA